MKKILFLSALFAALFAFVSETSAQRASKAQIADAGVFYQITGKKLKKPSYLLGTFHLMCQKDLFPSETIKSYLDRTEKLMLEIDLSDAATMRKAAEGMMIAGGKTTKDYLKPDEYSRLDELFKNYLGVSYDRFQTFKPFMTTTVLMMSPKIIGCQASPGYDKILADMAIARKMPVVGLETVEDEYAAIDAQPIEKQIEALNKFAANPEKGAADFKKLYQTYLTQNSAALYKMVDEQMKADGGGSTEKLLDERNAKWIPTIEKNIRLAASFIAVGGGHLGGRKGVVNLLRARGYKLTAIKL